MSVVARAVVLLVALGVAALAAGAVAKPKGPGRTPLPGDVDADGVFVLGPMRTAEHFPGDGVRLLVSGVGRLQPGATAPSVFLRYGAFERWPLGLSKAEISHAASLREAVQRFARGNPDLAFSQSLLVTPTERDPNRYTVVTDAPAPPEPIAPRASLAAWAPADRPFLRFRDVERALRCADIADQLASRLNAARGDGRSYETLRWGLHDLLLPTIWKTNPTATKGAGECALVLDGPLTARPKVALLLRIVDPELHDMQTRAGIAQEAHEDHLWRPADDPFPETRARRNSRRTIGGFEIVATARALFRDVLASTVTHADDPRWHAARAAAPEGTDEAMLAVFPADATWAERPSRSDSLVRNERWTWEAAGAAWLAKKWTGYSEWATAALPGPEDDRMPRVPAGLASVRVVLDMAGARVTCTFDGAAAARAAEAAIAAAAQPLANHADVCRACRRDLLPVALVEPRTSDLAERCFEVQGFKPVCPNGGRFACHPVTRAVECSVHGSDARPLGAAAPAPLVRDLARDGAVVRLLFPIDWNRNE